MDRRPRRTLSEIDRTAWADYARTVAALPGRAERLPPLPPPEKPVPASPVAAPPGAVRPAARGAPAALSVGVPPGGLDGASWQRLRTGKLAPERKLDLHGRTVQAAFHALHGFLLAAHAGQVRCVEVVTGRGSGEGGGVIRRELPLWLNQPALRPLVLAAVHPHPANPGAVRLLLRRLR